MMPDRTAARVVSKRQYKYNPKRRQPFNVPDSDTERLIMSTSFRALLLAADIKIRKIGER